MGAKSRTYGSVKVLLKPILFRKCTLTFNHICFNITMSVFLWTYFVSSIHIRTLQNVFLVEDMQYDNIMLSMMQKYKTKVNVIELTVTQ